MNRVWEHVISRLKEQFPILAISSYLDGTETVDVHDSTLTIVFTSPFRADVVSLKYVDAIREAAEEVMQAPVDVEILVDFDG